MPGKGMQSLGSPSDCFSNCIPPCGILPRKTNMRKIQVLLPEEMIAYLQGIVDSGETESMSQTIRKIIMKEMKSNETQ